MANQTREVSAVTGACLAVRKTTFIEVGGFDLTLAIGCNDVLLCADLLARGYRNVCLGTPLLTHFEFGSRGRDETEEERLRAVDEGRYLRSQHKLLFQNDPYYNPNLSYEQSYELAFPPRRRKPWQKYLRASGKLRVLLLSFPHLMRSGLSDAVKLQSAELVRRGHEVLVGRPYFHEADNFEGCTSVELDHPKDAAIFAVANDVDCVVALTPPFFSVVRWLGDWPRCILYDCSDPDLCGYRNIGERREQKLERYFCLGIADDVFTVATLRPTGLEESADWKIIPTWNSHLPAWSADSLPRREQSRREMKWLSKIVVLNVCYAGGDEAIRGRLNRYAASAEALKASHPNLADQFEFVFCGGEGAEAVAKQLGFAVPSVRNEQELTDIYCAADLYLCLAEGEEYSLGVERAVALGLTLFTPEAEKFMLDTLFDRVLSEELSSSRASNLRSWDEPLKEFASAIEGICCS